MEMWRLCIEMWRRCMQRLHEQDNKIQALKDLETRKAWTKVWL
jgi:hypothetical protein